MAALRKQFEEPNRGKIVLQEVIAGTSNDFRQRLLDQLSPLERKDEPEYITSPMRGGQGLEHIPCDCGTVDPIEATEEASVRVEGRNTTNEHAGQKCPICEGLYGTHNPNCERSAIFAPPRDCSCRACQNSSEVLHEAGCPWHMA